jgi:hypothetical protein
MEFLVFQVTMAVSRFRRIGEIQPILVKGHEWTPYTLFRLQLRFPGLVFEPIRQGPDWLLRWSFQ